MWSGRWQRGFPARGREHRTAHGVAAGLTCVALVAERCAAPGFRCKRLRPQLSGPRDCREKSRCDCLRDRPSSASALLRPTWQKIKQQVYDVVNERMMKAPFGRVAFVQ
eukprot:1188287-Prorocentrum_minimum.AAC.2